jgi:hypothetical protein
MTIQFLIIGLLAYALLLLPIIIRIFFFLFIFETLSEGGYDEKRKAKHVIIIINIMRALLIN